MMLHLPAMKLAVALALAVLPASVITSLRRQHRRVWMGSLRRDEPLSRGFGKDRGTPIDRHYIEGFLGGRAADICGNVLEVGDAEYTRRFGGRRVERGDVLHVTGDNPEATIVGDLATGQGIPAGRFDCMICTQTIGFIFDVNAAVRNIHRLLRPGGVALVTVPGISQICRYDMDRWGDYWRFTTQSAQRMFADVFGAENIEVRSHGNVLAAVGFLHGMSRELFSEHELDRLDRDYQVIISVRAVKARTGSDAATNPPSDSAG